MGLSNAGALLDASWLSDCYLMEVGVVSSLVPTWRLEKVSLLCLPAAVINGELAGVHESFNWHPSTDVICQRQLKSRATFRYVRQLKIPALAVPYIPSGASVRTLPPRDWSSEYLSSPKKCTRRPLVAVSIIHFSNTWLTDLSTVQELAGRSRHARYASTQRPEVRVLVHDSEAFKKALRVISAQLLGLVAPRDENIVEGQTEARQGPSRGLLGFLMIDLALP